VHNVFDFAKRCHLSDFRHVCGSVIHILVVQTFQVVVVEELLGKIDGVLVVLAGKDKLTGRRRNRRHSTIRTRVGRNGHYAVHALKVLIVRVVCQLGLLCVVKCKLGLRHRPLAKRLGGRPLGRSARRIKKPRGFLSGRGRDVFAHTKS